MKMISFSHQDDYENGRVCLHYRYQVCPDLVEGERVILFAGDTHDQSCMATLFLGDHGFYIGRPGPRFVGLWLAELDESTWTDLTEDQVSDYYRNEHIPFAGVPSSAEWNQVFKPQYDIGDNCNSTRKH